MAAPSLRLSALILSLVTLVAPHVALGDDVSLPAPSYIGEWGVAGTDTGAFSTVRGIACGPDGRVFVADWGNQRVQVFAPDSSSPSIIDFSLSDENYSLAPWDLTVDPEDTLYVASFGGIIQRFDPTGSRIPGEWKTADFEVPGQLPGQNIEGIEASPHYIYVTVSRLSGSPPHNNGGIVQLARSGSVQREIAVWDSTNQFINELQGLATDRLDNVYVVINFTSALSAPLQTAIRKYDKNGLRLANWSMTPGDIQGLCCDASRVLYYTTASGHVRVLADQSETACDNNASDSPRGNFSIIEGLACDSTSRLYVVDRRNGLERVVVLDIDADGDGLLDAWEKYGIVASNVKPNYQLDDSHVQKKDLYIELDYAGGDTLFTTAALEMLADSLAVVPSSYFARPNPGDYPGVMLHLQADEIAGTQTWDEDFRDTFRAFKDDHFGTIAERDSGVLAAKRLAYRYCIAVDVLKPDGLKSTSGIAEPNGNDVIVAYSALKHPTTETVSTEDLAGTLMHELGHTFGLQHGGKDDINYKPNYHSIMNYTWQLKVTSRPAWARGWRLAYSPEALPTLDEGCLDDLAGIGDRTAGSSTERVVVPYGPFLCDENGRLTPQYANASGVVDWNKDGWQTCGDSVTNARDLNRWTSPSCVQDDSTNGQLLVSYEDWKNVLFLPRTTNEWRVDAHANMLGGGGGGELGAEEIAAMHSAIFDCNQNGLEDEADIAEERSLDLDGNTLPDECEPPVVTGWPDSVVMCVGGDADSIRWSVDLVRFETLPLSDPDLLLYAVMSESEPGVFLWAVDGSVIADGDTLWRESYDSDTKRGTFVIRRAAGCGEVTFAVYAQGVVVATPPNIGVRSLDGDQRVVGGVDQFDEETLIEAWGEGVPGCWDLDESGEMGGGDLAALYTHRGHHVVRMLKTPNGGQTWTTGGTAVVSWRRGFGDSSRVEVLARSGPTGPTTLLAHALPDTGSATVGVPAGLDTCANCCIEIRHTAGVFEEDVQGEEIGRDASDQSITVQDGVRPAAVVLGVDLIGTHSVTVTMEAPGDDSLSRQATTYDLRYSTLQINSDSRWQSASQEFGEPSPGNPGSETFLTADSLQLCTTYYFAVKTRDEAGNWSGLSNSPSAKTLCSGGGFAGETSEHAHLADTGIGHSRPASADVRLSSARDSEVRGLTQSRLVLSEDFDGQNRVFKILRMPEADADDSCSTRDPHAFMWLNSTEHERNVCPPSYVPSAETQLIGVARAARAGTRLVLPLGASVQSIAPTLAIETSDGLTELHFVTLTDQRESSTDSPDSARSIIEALVVGDTLTLSYARSAGRTVVDDRWSVLVTLPESSARQSESSQSGQSLAVPKRFALRPPVPNPFASGVAIGFDVPRSARARIDVFDLAGRRVRVLADREFEAGTHHVSWDGRNGSGGQSPSGVYLCRLSAQGFSADRRIILLR